ncbi:MAG: NifB/NifX family molybdenum-iron cluster-binding protein [Bacteroidota bacterium]
MKVIIPVVDQKESMLVLAEGFHKTEHACIYDSENDTYEWVHMHTISEIIGELGMQLKLMGVEKIISKHIPLMALSLFTDYDIQVFKAQEGNVRYNISMLHKNKLRNYTIDDSKAILRCPGICDSCESDCD